MSSALALKWTWIDALIQSMRFRMSVKHIPDDVFLVDVGCGTGSLLKFLEQRLKKGIGLDNSIADHNLLENIELKKCRIDQDRLPIEDNCVDIVTSLAVLEHLENPQHLIDEAMRILKPGGKLILTTPSPLAKPVLEFLAFRCRLISKEDIQDHKHYFSRSELAAMTGKFSRFEYHPFQLWLNQMIVTVK